MKILQSVGGSYRTNYDALNNVIGTNYDKHHHPQGGLFRPKGFAQDEAVWFADLFEDDDGWLNQKHVNGEIWETNARGAALDENLNWQDPQIKRVTFTRQNPKADWVFEGVYCASGVVQDSRGRRWRKYVAAP